MLTQSVLNLYNKDLVLDVRYKNDPSYIFISLDRLNEQIEKLPAFVESAETMKNDENMKKLQGMLVGALSTLSLVQDEKSCILSFLKQIYFKNPVYSQGLFDSAYLNFEELFYSPELQIKDSTRLYNFHNDGDEISLADGLIIKKKFMPPSKREGSNAMISMGYLAHSASAFIIQRNYKATKRMESSTSDRPHTPLPIEEIESSSNIFDFVITSLRVLKSSGVYRDYQIQSETTTFHPSGGINTSSPFFENIVIGEKCILISEEIEEFANIFNFIKDNTDSRFGVALRRLASGMERRNKEDQLIDYMIGLEALYLPDGNHELSFRLSLRVAFLLNSDSKDRKEEYLFLRQLYKSRSKIVHGNPFSTEHNDILRIEELLRKSLKLWISDPDNFSINKFSNSGVLQMEGKLDNIFFES